MPNFQVHGHIKVIGPTIQSIDQSINVKSVVRRYTTRPGAPTVVSGKHDHKVHS